MDGHVLPPNSASVKSEQTSKYQIPTIYLGYRNSTQETQLRGNSVALMEKLMTDMPPVPFKYLDILIRYKNEMAHLVLRILRTLTLTVHEVLLAL